jgi:hypothetical protein
VRFVLIFLIISHVSHGFTFSGKNLRSFNTWKISNPWLRYSQKIKSKSSKMITRESMSIMRYMIFSMRQGFISSTQFPILGRKMELLRKKTDL